MRIGARFCGPPESGNGGYTAGLLARSLCGAVEVTLRAPPPLERELDTVPRDVGIDLLDDSRLIAEARPSTLTRHELNVPSFEAACEASRDYVGFREHYFPDCFVCGPARAPGDGLRIFPAALGEHLVAAPWEPAPSLSPMGSGDLPAELMWAALDCVGYFAIAQPMYPMALLGRMTAEVFAPACVGERYVVVGAPLSREGRKLFARTAVYTADGQLCGHAHQTWIALSRSSSSYPPLSSRRLPVAAPATGEPDPAHDVLAKVMARVPKSQS